MLEKFNAFASLEDYKHVVISRNMFIFYLAIIFLLLPACQSKNHNPNTRFKSLPAPITKIDFRNDLQANADQNIFNYLYFYNGGGVGIGDLDGDDLPEIYFSSNQGTDKLYRNLGNMQFEDVSRLLGETSEDWSTGVSFADVNADGLLDIYVSVATPVSKNPDARNRLYINESRDGVIKLREAAADFGLDQTGYGTQAAFFDFDRDGDLDCYQLNHSVHALGTFQRRSTQLGSVSELAGDRLLERTEDGYLDISKRANIKQMALGYGLGLSIADLNQDGWLDIYIGNDFHEDDYAYINQQDGTFKDELRKMMPHTSRFTMGTDVADLNNDGRPEIMSLDMLPSDPVVLKAAAAEDPYDIWHMKQRQGYWPQFSRNNLQFNLGIPPGDSLPRFGDRGIQAGIYATDWSWSVLMEDYDQDGFRDIFISNGILGRSNDMDYINYVTEDAVQSRLKDMEVDEEDLQLADRMPVIKLPNAAFKSRRDGTFEYVSEAWGFEESTFSHGAAHADLDGDGDLDIVVNNVNDYAGIYENQSRQLDTTQILEVRLIGGENNKLAYGALIQIVGEDRILYSQELQPVRGFQSSVDPGKLIIAFKPAFRGATLQVYWPEGEISEQIIEAPGELTIDRASSNFRLPQVEASRRPSNIGVEASRINGIEGLSTAASYTTMAAENFGIDFIHEENSDYVDFNRELLMPHMVSREGPAMANFTFGGENAIFIGGAKWQPAVVYVQAESQLEYERVSTPDLEADAKSEDVDAMVVDYNGDGLQDLLVLSGGGEFPDGHEANELRFYKQTSSAQLIRDREALAQPLRLNGGSLALVDQPDGHWQIVVAGRSVVDGYGERPPMYIIYPDQLGKLQSAPIDIDWSSIGGAGLIRDIDVAELTQDEWPDLLIASEWGPIVLLPGSAEGFRPQQSRASAMLRPAEVRLIARGRQVLPSKNGFWSAIATADLDGDGDLDILAGNLGANSKLAADSSHLIKLYYDDFDGNGKREQIITYTSSLGERPFATREEIIGQLPGLRQIVPDHTSFAEASLQSLFSANKLASAQQFVIDQTRSVWLENRGDGEWVSHELPDEIQSGPVELILPGLYNDWLFFGQDRGANIQRGHYDAALGWSLAGSYFTQNQGSPSPLYVNGRVRDGLLLDDTNGLYYVLALNAESLKLLMEQGLNR